MAQASRRRKSSKKPARKSRGGSSWGMLIIGLVSGSVLAVLILGAHEGNRYGFGSGLKTLFTPAPRPPAAGGREQTGSERQQTKPTLDFYTVLPKIERIISDPASPVDHVRETEDESAMYVLQIAAYENFNDADRLKAQLTITGYDAAIQKVTIDEKVYYRVRLGPYKSRRRLKNVKQELAELGIKGGMQLRVTDP